MKKVLVTGGAGFIGNSTVEQLIRQGMSVVVVDSLQGAQLPIWDESVAFYQMNLISEQLEQVFAIERPDYVIHLAAQISVRRSLQDPYLDAESNIMGTINLLKQCVRYEVKKIVFASSAAVYGTPANIPVMETDRTAPLSFYGISKLVAERYIQSFSHQTGLEYAILRYSNVYGARNWRSGESGVIMSFVERTLEGQVLDIFGDGEQTRDFIYVKDVALANVLALSGGQNEIINISGGSGITLLEMIDLLKEISGKSPILNFLPQPPGDIKHSALSNLKAGRLLGWSPSFTLYDGLRNLISLEEHYIKN